MAKVTPSMGNKTNMARKPNPHYVNANMRDYHVKGPLGMGFYSVDFDTVLSGGGGAAQAIHPGYTFLTESEKVRAFNDFRNLSEDYETVISSNVLDLSGNGHEAVPTNSVKTSVGLLSGQTVSDLHEVKGFNSDGTTVAAWKCMVDAGNAQDLHATSHEFGLTINSFDPYATNPSEYFYGFDLGDGNQCILYLPTNGRVNFKIGNDDQGFAHYVVTNAIYTVPDVAMGNLTFWVKVDFENDIVAIWINGSPQPLGTVVNISTITPNNNVYGTSKVAIGWATNGSVPITGAIKTEKIVLNRIVTDLLTDEERANVLGYMGAENATIPSKSVRIMGDLRTLAAKSTPPSGGYNLEFGICLSEAPSSDVTITPSSVGALFTIAPSSFTFTTSNWAATQKLRITAVEDSVTRGITYDDLRFTKSGGGYSGTQDIEVRLYDSGIPEFFIKGFNWMKKLSVRTLATIASQRAYAINYTTNGNGLPALTPTISTFMGAEMHDDPTAMIDGVAVADLTGTITVDDYAYTMQDIDGYDWTNHSYLIKRTDVTHNGKLHIESRGHTGDHTPGREAMFNELLALGYHILHVALPVSGDNTTTNPTITATDDNARHNQILTGGLGSDSRVPYWSPLELFGFDIHSSIAYLKDNYSQISMSGVSGGGKQTLWVMALNLNISLGCSIRAGIKDIIYKRAEDGSGDDTDYETGGSFTNFTNSGTQVRAFFDTVPYFDWYMLACTGGRKWITSYHYNDEFATLRGFTWNEWKPKFQELASAIGGTYDGFVDIDPANTSHEYSTFDIEKVLDLLGE